MIAEASESLPRKIVFHQAFIRCGLDSLKPGAENKFSGDNFMVY
jgi:hypothetical protein